MELVNRSQTLEIPHPKTQLERMEVWGTLSDEDRRRRAAEALLHGDRESLSSLLESYLCIFGRKGLRASRNTLISYRKGLEEILDFSRREGIKAHQFTRQHALRFARHLEARGQKPATVNARLAGARAFYRSLIWTKMAETNPFDRLTIEDPTPLAERCNPYSQEEISAMLAAGNDRENALVLLGWDAGLRLSEVAALRWQDLNRQTRKLVIRSGKGGKKRSVKVTARTIEAFLSLPRNSENIFGICPRRIQVIFKRLCERAGVEHRGFHALRHTSGTELFRLTKNLKIVARHLGHSNTSVSDRYAHLADMDYEEAVDQLSGAHGEIIYGDS